MKRSELVRSREYWISDIQLKLFNLIEGYRKRYNLTKTQIADKLGFTKGYITQILNGDFDHKLSKLVDLSLAFGKVPIVHFVDMSQYLLDDESNNLKVYNPGSKPIEYNIYIDPTPLEESMKKYVNPSPMHAASTNYSIVN